VLVVHVDDAVLAEVLERDLLSQAVAVVPDFVRPLLEIDVVGDPALEGDGLVLGAPGRFAAGARIASLAMLDHFGGPLERADLADAGDVAPLPLNSEFEVLVRFEPLS